MKTPPDRTDDTEAEQDDEARERADRVQRARERAGEGVGW